MDGYDLEKLCSMLESLRVKQRSEACDCLQEFLGTKSTTDALNTNPKNWSRLLNAILTCLFIDHDKKLEDFRKRGSVYDKAPHSADIWTLFMRVAVKNSTPIDFLQLFRSVVKWVQDPTKKQLHCTCYKVLSQSLLVNINIRAKLEEKDWKLLFVALKATCRGETNFDIEQIKCLSLILKLGPLHNFPVEILREQFTFITVLCRGVTSRSPKPQQYAVLEIIQNFCYYTAKDNRMACCKLGEDTFLNLLELYQGNLNDDKMKANLIEFFLLQVSLHNPKGVKEEHPAAFAVSWDFWKDCLLNMYNVLTYDIDANLQLTVKNKTIFVCINGVSELFTTFVQLFVEVCRQLFGSNNNTEDGPPRKRAKMELNFASLVDKIMTTKSWAWLNLTYPLIETYPEIITLSDYINILKNLVSLQAESKEPNLLRHIYKALIILQNTEKLIKVEKFQVDEIWKRVAESTFRSINQNDENVQTLLQLLILKNYFTSHESLFQNYRPGGALNLTPMTLKTLDVAFKSFPILQTDKSLKIQLMRWILSGSTNQFSCSNVAEILVCLTLKQWPNLNYDSSCVTRPFDDIENIYFTVCFENLLVPPENNKETDSHDVFCLDQILFAELTELLAELTTDIRTPALESLNISGLIFNVVAFLHHYNLVETNEITTLGLYQNFAKHIETVFGYLNFQTETNERITQAINIAETLDILFRSKVSNYMSAKLRELVTQPLIVSMFRILNLDSEGDLYLKLKKRIVESLVSFSCLPASSSLQIQEKALQALLNFDYDFSVDDNYELALTLFHSFETCKPENLSEKSLASLFNVLQKFCEVRYCCYMSVNKFLDFIYGFLPVVTSSSVDCKSQFVGILHPFYTCRMSYGPFVSVRLLNCVRLLFELELTADYIKWSDEEIITKIPEYLRSDYQEVRFAAIKVLAAFFKGTSQTRDLQDFHKQEIIFSEISDMTLKVLEIQGKVNENRLMDESVVRTSTIFHTFASIMLASNLWIEEAMFSLLKIVCDKKLDLRQVQTVIDMVAQHLGFKSGLKFREKYLVSLVNRWKSENFDTFPFEIFNCSSKSQFYSKYWHLLAHIFIENSDNSLSQVAQSLGKSTQRLIEDSCPRLISYCISQSVSDFASIGEKPIYGLLRDTLGVPKMHNIVKDNIEEVILCLVEFVCDEKSFESSFNQRIIFPKITDIRLNVGEFDECLDFIEVTLYDGNSVISHLMQNDPDKIHFILLQLNLRVNAVQTLEDKLRYFHLYSLIAILSINTVINQPKMQPYLLRDLTHTLLHNIKNHKNQPELSQISCKFFKKILAKTVPSLSTVISQLFFIIVSRLKYVALENCHVSSLCIDMLEFLIVEHKDLFVSQIEKLDSIPTTPEFERLYLLHYSVKYRHEVTFEDEIIQFLDSINNIESLDECEHSIIHLKTQLIQKKEELKSMCFALRLTRGLSEDCENSNLHKLICALITLSCSKSSKVSTEAVRCLGEIGATDLTTLILQPEKPIADPKWSPWELVLGCSVSLLSKYLVDADVCVIKVASLALFQILATNEGRKVTKSESDFGFGNINCSFFTPFFAVEPRSTIFRLDVNGDYFMTVLKEDQLWIPEHSCHETWITKLVCTLLECFEEREFFNSVIAVCKLKVDFCEQILPLIVYTVLYINNFSFTTVISSQIETFFNKHWDITINNGKSCNITTNKSSVQSMLNVINFIRLQKSVRKKEIKDMKIDYLKVAKAAHFCTAHFTALLYAEIWCQEKINQSPNDYALSTCSYTKLDLIYDKVDLVTGNALQNILRQAYKSVGETDALLGCGTSHLLSPASRVEHYKELGRWDQVTRYYEREVSLGRNEVLPSLVDGLKNANLYQLSLFCSQEPNYESLWRLGQWNYNVSDVNHTNYNKAKFCALKALHENEEFLFKKSLSEGRGCVIQDFMVTNMESIKNFYNTFGRLQSLKEIEDFAESVKTTGIADLLAKWKIQDEIVCNDYQYVEPVQAQRIILLTEWLKSHSESDLRDVIVDTIIEYAQYARIEGNSHGAFRILEHLRSLNLEDFYAKIQLEEAQLCWSIQDVVTAKCILRQLCSSDNINPKLHAMALKMTGQWMVESSSENRQTIIENYYKKSLELIKSGERTAEDEKCMIDTWDQLAKFTDREYQEVRSHIMSDVFQKRKQNIMKTKEMVNRINLKTTTKDMKKAVTIKQKFSCIDEIEIHNIETDKNNLLILALQYYLRILIATDNNDMTVFRLFSLLLENRDNEVVKSVLQKDILKVPTYKFINILPQIIPHISNTSNDLFTVAVNNIIERCAKDHPYHTVPLILSLALSHKDREYSESKAVVSEVRTQSAKAILAKLKKDPKLSTFIQRMEFVSEGIIELAYHTSDTGGTRGFKVPRKAKILKIQNFDNVLLPTYNLPVNKSCNYERIVGIAKFGDVYFNVGGINAPKRITCQGTDGITRTQLIKGQDDLRQDAVMQQVFTIMNKLLNMNKQTQKLRIRTYKIVALSMRSGILEWVDNTMPIAEYLTGERGDGGAHQKFRPSDSNPMKCRLDFKNAATNKSNEIRLRSFNKICEKIKPVFHKFFETNFPQPTVWYERRRTYIHSVATSSMCGYILGIGDRHLNNILIDKNTAEVVHIDFGIAFEQGRVLPTPETVPFRLTRDIVDGMGVSGVEGVFRRSCEKTVEVLRLHYQTIITILEVLLYDPLYDWTVSSAEANKRQKDEQYDSEINGSPSNGDDAARNVNETAERALLRLRAKLQGSESGKSTTVEHQVGTLIQQAVDPSNLSRLFYGWQPYL